MALEKEDGRAWRNGSAGQGRGGPVVSSTGTDGYGAIAASIWRVFPDAVVAPALVVSSTDSRHYAGISKDAYPF
jgi:carboxypeptidase PM20D1